MNYYHVRYSIAYSPTRGENADALISSKEKLSEDDIKKMVEEESTDFITTIYRSSREITEAQCEQFSKYIGTSNIGITI